MPNNFSLNIDVYLKLYYLLLFSIFGKRMRYNFDDIRPFNDDEYHPVVNELLQVETLQRAIAYYLPEFTLEQVTKMLNEFKSVQEFQADMACRLVQAIIDDSMESFSFNGVTALNNNESYLLMSNHRDIVLDSALINYCLNDKQYNTCEIAIGSNLLKKPWVKKLVRLNKSFIVKRNIPKNEMLEASKTLSAYIGHALFNKKQSVWIAQREGRAKDGNDKTNPGLLKMFALSNEGDLLDYIKSLNITPVSISYELDPTDYLKIEELLAKSKEESYVKAEGEDEKHMALGMQGNKGRVHVEFTGSINEELEKLRGIKNRNELLKEVAGIIDHSIYHHYKIWDTNYIAYDLLEDQAKFENKYTPEQKQRFLEYVETRLTAHSGSKEARDIFLGMYANPIKNKLSVAK